MDPKRNKRQGYAVEVRTLKMLRMVFPDIERRGTAGYHTSAPDLMQSGHSTAPFLPLIVTQDARHPLIVSMYLTDFVRFVGDEDPMPNVTVVVQVKARQITWVGTLMARLILEYRKAKGKSSHRGSDGLPGGIV